MSSRQEEIKSWLDKTGTNAGTIFGKTINCVNLGINDNKVKNCSIYRNWMAGSGEMTFKAIADSTNTFTFKSSESSLMFRFIPYNKDAEPVQYWQLDFVFNSNSGRFRYIIKDVQFSKIEGSIVVSGLTNATVVV